MPVGSSLCVSAPKIISKLSPPLTAPEMKTHLHLLIMLLPIKNKHREIKRLFFFMLLAKEAVQVMTSSRTKGSLLNGMCFRKAAGKQIQEEKGRARGQEGAWQPNYFSGSGTVLGNPREGRDKCSRREKLSLSFALPLRCCVREP